jgi:hypothetical protein
MKTHVAEIPKTVAVSNQEVAGNSSPLRRWMAASFLFFAGGTVSAIGGFVLGAASYIGLVRNPTTANTTANLLIIAAFPLMMCGAHALDRISEIKKAERSRESHVNTPWSL